MRKSGRFVCIIMHVSVTKTVFLSLCHILFRDHQDREPAHASIPGDVEDHKDVRDQSWSTKIYLISKSNSNSHKFVS